METYDNEQTNSLNRSLGLPMLTFYGCGMILGAGIYSIVGKAAGIAEGTIWMSFLIAGIAALLTGLSYAELASMYPKAGAEYTYLKQAFKKNHWISIVVGVLVALAGAASAATVALAFSGYFEQFIVLPNALTAVILLMIFTAVAIIGVRESGWLNIVFTLVEVLGLLIVIYFAFTSDVLKNTFSWTITLGTLSSATLVMFSFFGFENIANFAEEAKNPGRDIPRAIILSIIISLVLYILVGLACLMLLSPAELFESSAPLMDAVRVASEKWANVLGAIALFSTANTALLSLITSSRVFYGMAKDNALPSKLGLVLPKKRTPWVATLLALFIALLLLPLGKVEAVARASSFMTMIAFLGVNVSLIRLRYIDQSTHRPFKVPFSVGKLPILPLLGTVFSILFILKFLM